MVMEHNYWNKTIHLNQSVVGTTDVMKWCDEHPEESLCHTRFTSELERGGLIASSIDEREISTTLMLHPYEEWHEVFGWLRYGSLVGFAVWYCKKIGENKLIYITEY